MRLLLAGFVLGVGAVTAAAADWPASWTPRKRHLRRINRATPAIADGHFFIRTMKTLHCIGQ